MAGGPFQWWDRESPAANDSTETHKIPSGQGARQRAIPPLRRNNAVFDAVGTGPFRLSDSSWSSRGSRLKQKESSLESIAAKNILPLSFARPALIAS